MKRGQERRGWDDAGFWSGRWGGNYLSLELKQKAPKSSTIQRKTVHLVWDLLDSRCLGDRNEAFENTDLKLENCNFKF